jgi:hypothetical protein
MRVEVLKPTNDDWHGSYSVKGWISPNGTDQMFVQVIFNGMIGNGIWRTCVWGNDDCGMEYDCYNEQECWCKFLEVIGMEYVDMVVLSALDFVSA